MKNFTNSRNSIIDQLRDRPIPYYNHFLFLEGYTPMEILQAEESPEDRYLRKRHQENHRDHRDDR